MNLLKSLCLAGSLLAFVSGSALPVSAQGAAPAAQSAAATAIDTKAVSYTQGSTALEGWLATPKEASGKLPAVLLIHDWMGVAAYAKSRTEQLAGLGYVVLAADIYGKSVRPDNPKSAAEQAGIYKGDRALFRQRLLAGLEELKKQPNVDPARIAAIGYCFGGTGVLELARAGADVKGVVSFHGGLDSPTPADGKNIKAKVLILHGADDPFVKPEGIAAMISEFNAAKVDWQMTSYSGAVHSFTQKAAGDDNSKGTAYNALADKRSWQALRDFLNEVLAPKDPIKVF
ncbi:MAG: dienelactone hydrolase family protein [Verrucomicrobiaceae bacterium]|nr:MAG: dienelactone hydrolase family protein [Verrucomicrobiaceae bacterium]